MGAQRTWYNKITKKVCVLTKNLGFSFSRKYYKIIITNKIGDILKNNKRKVIITPDAGCGTADIVDEIIPFLALEICVFAAGGKSRHIVNGE